MYELRLYDGGKNSLNIDNALRSTNSKGAMTALPVGVRTFIPSRKMLQTY